MKRKQQNFRLDPVTVETLRFISAKEGKSMAQVIDTAVEKYFIANFEAELEKAVSYADDSHKN